MDDDVVAAVGPRLREIRAGRRQTLAAVSAATGISVSTLSRLESGGRRATLELLLPLARHYRLPLDDLVAAPAVGDPRIHARPTRRNGMIVIPLTALPGPQQAFKMVIPATRATPDLCRHDGFEWLYVLSGALRLVLGDRDVTMASGEAAEFDTRTPHWFGSTGSGTVEAISLLGLQGERVHLAAPATARSPAPEAPERLR